MRNRRSRSAADFKIDFSRFKDEDHPILDPSPDSHLPIGRPMLPGEFFLGECYRRYKLGKLLQKEFTEEDLLKTVEWCIQGKVEKPGFLEEIPGLKAIVYLKYGHPIQLQPGDRFLADLFSRVASRYHSFDSPFHDYELEVVMPREYVKKGMEEPDFEKIPGVMEKARRLNQVLQKK